jgi:HEAT repeat protein
MKRTSWIIAAVSLLTIGVLAVVILRGRREPVCEGKRPSIWLRELEKEVQVDGRLSQTTQVAKAIQRIGANACPSLLAMLRSKDSPLKRRLVSLVHRQSFLRFDIITSDRLRARAHYAFVVLGPLTEPEVPSVVACLSDENPRARSSAANILSFIDSNGLRCVPGLIRALQDPDHEVRSSGAIALRQIDIHTKSSEFEASGSIPESRLKAAVPALKSLLNDRDLSVQTAAALALQQIGPLGSE